MHEADTCPVCGEAYSANPVVDRVCAVCGMTIDGSATHFAVAGPAGLRFLCSPGCTRSFVAVAAVAGGRR